MKLAILGAGAIGSHLAARLARAGIPAPLIARPATAATLAASGLTFRSAGEEFTVSVPVTADPASLGPQDAVILAVKAHALGPAMATLAPLLGPDTRVVFAVNGIPWWYGDGARPEIPPGTLDLLDPGGTIRRTVRTDRVIGAVVHSANRIVVAGTVSNASARNRFVLGRPDGEPDEALDALARHLGRALDVVEISPDIRRALWEKLLHNLAASPVGCLTLAPADRIAADPELRGLYVRIAAEGRAVAGALGIPLVDETAARLAAMATLAHRSSMQQDLLAGNRLELDAQLLAVRALARAFEVPIPTLDILIPLLAARAAAGPV